MNRILMTLIALTLCVAQLTHALVPHHIHGNGVLAVAVHLGDDHHHDQDNGHEGCSASLSCVLFSPRLAGGGDEVAEAECMPDVVGDVFLPPLPLREVSLSLWPDVESSPPDSPVMADRPLRAPPSLPTF